MIEFTVKGIPVPQGSMRAFLPKNGRYPVVTSDNPRLKQWRRTVRAEAIKAIGFDEPAGSKVPIRVEISFFLPRAKSNRALDAVKKPDLDKLIRSCLDAMSKVLYQDDSQVVEVHAFKLYGEPRAEIRVEDAGICAVPVKHERIEDAKLPF